jgi:transcriptional regulator with XRE-family HTH domain
LRYFERMTNTLAQRNWIPDTASFAARLALVRWRMGWNIREAERECNLSQNSWAGYENGREPRKFIEVVNRIVLRTGVDRIWLMTGEGSPETPPLD